MEKIKNLGYHILYIFYNSDRNKSYVLTKKINLYLLFIFPKKIEGALNIFILEDINVVETDLLKDLDKFIDFSLFTKSGFVIKIKEEITSFRFNNILNIDEIILPTAIIREINIPIDTPFKDKSLLSGRKFLDILLYTGLLNFLQNNKEWDILLPSNDLSLNINPYNTNYILSFIREKNKEKTLNNILSVEEFNYNGKIIDNIKFILINNLPDFPKYILDEDNEVNEVDQEDVIYTYFSELEMINKINSIQLIIKFFLSEYEDYNNESINIINQ